jgi:hypothetical protein
MTMTLGSQQLLKTSSRFFASSVCVLHYTSWKMSLTQYLKTIEKEIAAGNATEHITARQ